MVSFTAYDREGGSSIFCDYLVGKAVIMGTLSRALRRAEVRAPTLEVKGNATGCTFLAEVVELLMETLVHSNCHGALWSTHFTCLSGILNELVLLEPI